MNRDDRADKQRAFAWAKYYNELRTSSTLANVVVEQVQNIMTRDAENRLTIPNTIPQHFTREFLEMAIELDKRFTCPVCLELVTPETIKVPMCGHILCNGCYDVLIEQPREQCKCPICRKKLK